DLPSGPAALARAAGVALLPVFVFRRGRHRSQLVFRPPIRVAGRGDDALAEAVRRIGADVEWAIRREPHQWFCFRELWPKLD
ncbi:MAG: lipid A biosynthesis acyltransferase, partial [bacterium]|nr:lipid A biosynthesis acyltransferase [bacterium]